MHRSVPNSVGKCRDVIIHHRPKFRSVSRRFVASNPTRPRLPTHSPGNLPVVPGALRFPSLPRCPDAGLGCFSSTNQRVKLAITIPTGMVYYRSRAVTAKQRL